MTGERSYLAELFWSKVAKGDGCWEWLGTKGIPGYGTFYHEGVQHSAHRLAYELAHGLRPDSLRSDEYICHRCDHPPCVNPAHLFKGDASANAIDMVAKGFHPSQIRARAKRSTTFRNSRAMIRQAFIEFIDQQVAIHGCSTREAVVACKMLEKEHA